MTDAILTLNAGSSSLKFALYDDAHARSHGPVVALARGQIDAISTHPRLTARTANAPAATRPLTDGPIPHERAAAEILSWLKARIGATRRLSAIGHRVVHGGPHIDAPRRIDDALLAELRATVPLAPLHQPQSLAVIAAAQSAAPGVPQVACFDTAFHRSMPRVAQTYAIPHKLTDEGAIRYGFHGLSFEFIAGELSRLNAQAPRTVIAHLGNGASLCALHNGRSVATSMGLSALDGLMMGTRPGTLDPGVIFYLHQRHNMPLADIERTLYTQSGLLGVSGITSDVRELLASTDPRARFAMDLFAYRAAREIASHAAAMHGIDALVFTAGIGEHAAPVRAAICEGCRWLGLELDPAANAAHAPVISTPSSRITVRVIPTDEEAVIARHTASLTALN